MIYSPSQTKTWLTCPQARQYNQEGWTQRFVEQRDWTAWIGQGVHAGLAYLLNPALHGKPEKAGVIAVGIAEWCRHYDHAVKSGRIIPGNLFYIGEAKAQVERCLEYAMQYGVIPHGFEVTGVEQELEDYSCILDVVGTLNCAPSFIDWKVTNRLSQDKDDKAFLKYRYDWKEARHYPWALSQVTGQKVLKYHVGVFVLTPRFRYLPWTYEVNWPVVERWAEGCHSMGGVWDAMKELETYQSNQCHPGAWGFPCEYLDACWTYNTDRERMKQGGFIQVERLPKG